MKTGFLGGLLIAIVVQVALLIGLLAVLRGRHPVADVTLLNVSHDSTREMFVEINEAFARRWREQSGGGVTVYQVHGASGQQARAVIGGLEADVVALAAEPDIDLIAQAGLLRSDWRAPQGSTPFTTTIVFLVRAGNPKRIHDWPDLLRDDVKVAMPSPSVSGSGRFAYLAAYGWALGQPGGGDGARAFVSDLLARGTLAHGAREAVTAFVEDRAGDVLLTWESDAMLQTKRSDVEVVAPSRTILARLPAALVDHNVDRHGTRRVATSYLEFLFSDEAQAIAARHFFRPHGGTVAQGPAARLEDATLFTIEQAFGSWTEAQATHFDPGGVCERVLARLREQRAGSEVR